MSPATTKTEGLDDSDHWEDGVEVMKRVQSRVVETDRERQEASAETRQPS